MSLITKSKRILKKVKIQLLKTKYEHVYQTNGCKLKYLFMPNAESDFLMVVFSAFPSPNRPAAYNYVDTFKNVKCNKLYILDDFGPDIRGGSYYLGKDKNLFIEGVVTELIDKKAKDLGINKENIITTGTSKGGFASLYFSFKNSYGYAIVGAPQTLLGNYLSDHKSYFEYISGSYSEENVEYLNNLLLDKVEKSKQIPKLFLHVGKGEHHYTDHILPFCEILQSKNISYELDAQNYNNHNEVGKFYPGFAIKHINDIVS